MITSEKMAALNARWNEIKEITVAIDEYKHFERLRQNKIDALDSEVGVDTRNESTETGNQATEILLNFLRAGLIEDLRAELSVFGASPWDFPEAQKKSCVDGDNRRITLSLMFLESQCILHNENYGGFTRGNIYDESHLKEPTENATLKQKYIDDFIDQLFDRTECSETLRSIILYKYKEIIAHSRQTEEILRTAGQDLLRWIRATTNTINQLNRAGQGNEVIFDSIGIKDIIRNTKINKSTVVATLNEMCTVFSNSTINTTALGLRSRQDRFDKKRVVEEHMQDMVAVTFFDPDKYLQDSTEEKNQKETMEKRRERLDKIVRMYPQILRSANRKMVEYFFERDGDKLPLRTHYSKRDDTIRQRDYFEAASMTKSVNCINCALDIDIEITRNDWKGLCESYVDNRLILSRLLQVVDPASGRPFDLNHKVLNTRAGNVSDTQDTMNTFPDDQPLLYFALEKNCSLEIIDLLLAAGADPNVRYRDMPILAWAFRLYMPSQSKITGKVVDRLLEAGASIDEIKNDYVNDAALLQLAVALPSIRLFDAVMYAPQIDKKEGLDHLATKCKALQIAASKANTEFLQQMLQETPQEERISVMKEARLLELAAKMERGEEMTSMLIELGDDPKTRLGYSPLMIATQYGNMETMKKLIASDAGVDALPDEEGATALHYAAGLPDSTNGYKSRPTPEGVQLLISAGADVNAVRHSSGETPFLRACMAGNTDIVETFLRTEKTDKMVVDKTKRNALMHASGQCASNMVSLLLDGDIPFDVNAQDNLGCTALHHLCMVGPQTQEIIWNDNGPTLEEKQIAILNALAAKKIDLNVANTEGTTALMAAVSSQKHQLVRALLRMDVGIDIVDSKGMTALCRAIQSGDVELLHLLYQQGANPNIRHEGNDPLIQALNVHRGFSKKFLMLAALMTPYTSAQQVVFELENAQVCKRQKKAPMWVQIACEALYPSISGSEAFRSERGGHVQDKDYQRELEQLLRRYFERCPSMDQRKLQSLSTGRDLEAYISYTKPDIQPTARGNVKQELIAFSTKILAKAQQKRDANDDLKEPESRASRLSDQGLDNTGVVGRSRFWRFLSTLSSCVSQDRANDVMPPEPR